MRTVTAIVVAVLLLPLCGAAAEPARAPSVAEISWLAGSWAGEHDGGMIEEHWMAPSGGTMSGMNRLVIGERTVFHEYLRIVTAKDGGIDFMAQPVGRCPAVAFRLTSVSDSEVVFENPAHDDPKKITYRLEDGGKTLVAIVEGERNGKPTAHETRMSRATLAGK